MLGRVTRSMVRKAKEKSRKEENDLTKELVDEAESMEEFVRRMPDEKPTMVPDDFGDFDDAYGKQDDWSLGELSEAEDMDLEDAIMDDLANMGEEPSEPMDPKGPDMLKLRF